MQGAGGVVVGPDQESQRSVGDPGAFDVEPCGVTGPGAQDAEGALGDAQEVVDIGDDVDVAEAVGDGTDEGADRGVVRGLDQDHH